MPRLSKLAMAALVAVTFSMPALASQQTPPGPNPPPVPDSPDWPDFPDDRRQIEEEDDLFFDRDGDGCTSQAEITETLNEIDMAIVGPVADHTAGNGAALGGAAILDWLLGTCSD